MTSPDQFIFEGYTFEYDKGLLEMNYSLNGERRYQETATFEVDSSLDINREVVDRLCLYTFMIAGSSYYKSFPHSEVLVRPPLSSDQADFFTMIYRGGLSQFVYENNLRPDVLPKFVTTRLENPVAQKYEGRGVLLMQSGGKDSLLSSVLLSEQGHEFDAWHMSTTGKYPSVIDSIGAGKVYVSTRTIDIENIKEDRANGGMNGHIPFSALFAGFGLIQAALLGKSVVVASNEASADEANIEVDGYQINHQFSKTYSVELAIQQYLRSFVSSDISYGSILRPFTELKVGELFAIKAWPKFKSLFSSCNLANYKQGEDNGQLSWDGSCPKCANLFLLLAPFVDFNELTSLFEGKNLLQKPELRETYLGLLGRSDVKPLECVGTFDDMNQAYAMLAEKDSSKIIDGVEAETPDMDWRAILAHQSFFDELIDYKSL